ncbi:MAG: acylphosphatase [Victivallales bacterium]|nr:acylphosphatase [Victivallales bacterium]
MSVKGYRIIVKGRVTGVGFRFSTLNQAQKYPDLKGYVRNVCRNEVEVVIQGDEYEVNNLISWLRHGPSGARVDDIKISELPISSSLPPFKISFY